MFERSMPSSHEKGKGMMVKHEKLKIITIIKH
jgi:hypothetical protein